MNHKLNLALLLGLTVGLALPGLADNTIYGPSGLFRIPDAQVLAPGGLVGSVYIAHDVANTAAATVGVIRRLELSPAWVNPRRGDAETIISAKWQMWAEQGDRPAVALGVYDINDEINFTLYGVAQKSCTIGNTPVRVVAGFGENRSLVDGFFCGAELSLGKGISALVEYDGEDVNAGVRWPIPKQMVLTAGSVDGGLAVGLQYTVR